MTNCPDPLERDALERWESEGGPVGVVPKDQAEALKRAGEEERAREDSMDNIDDNAMEEARSTQSAKDEAADAAGNPAEQGGQG